MSNSSRESRVPTLESREAWHDIEEKLRVYLTEGLRRPRRDFSATILRIETPDNHSRGQCMRAIVAVGITTELLRQAGHLEEDIIPTASKLDFHTTMSMPLPFTPYAPADMATWHLPKMTSKQFLEDGKWTGICSHSLGHDHYPITWDAPMRGVQFTTHIKLSEPGRVFLKGCGVDHVGSFDLDGTLLQGDGSLQITKQVANQQQWYWRAYMTPFGIVGTWGKIAWGGWVWLWKDSSRTELQEENL